MWLIDTKTTHVAQPTQKGKTMADLKAALWELHHKVCPLPIAHGTEAPKEGCPRCWDPAGKTFDTEQIDIASSSPQLTALATKIPEAKPKGEKSSAKKSPKPVEAQPTQPQTPESNPACQVQTGSKGVEKGKERVQRDNDSPNQPMPDTHGEPRRSPRLQKPNELDQEQNKKIQ